MEGWAHQSRVRKGAGDRRQCTPVCMQGVRVGQCVNGRVGAPKQGCKRELATGDGAPHVHARGEGVRVGPHANGRGRTPFLHPCAQLIDLEKFDVIVYYQIYFYFSFS